MEWVDRALMTLSPADVAERISAYARNTPVDESYNATRRAITRMTPTDLAQVALAFDIPLPHDERLGQRVMFDDQGAETAVLAHFLTVPSDFKTHLERFLRAHPRALAYFDDADGAKILGIGVPRNRMAGRSRATSATLFGTIAIAVILAGLSVGALLGRIGHRSPEAPQQVIAQRLYDRTPPPHATPSPAPRDTPRVPAPTTTPTLTARSGQRPSTVSGPWTVNESNAQVGPIVWVGSAAASGGRVILSLYKDAVGGRPAMPCEKRTSLQATLSLGTAQTVPYREINCEGTVSVGEIRVDRFSGAGNEFQGSFWQGGMMLGTFDARRP